jgi:hypothetical protein
MEARTKITVYDMSLHKQITRTINDVSKQIFLLLDFHFFFYLNRNVTFIML